jgi:uncharacterized protein with PQ loop repeat
VPPSFPWKQRPRQSLNPSATIKRSPRIDIDVRELSTPSLQNTNILSSPASLHHECYNHLDQSVSVTCSTAAFAVTQVQLTLTLSSILLFLSLVSFIPQYHRILSRRDCSGISLNYVLFNLIAVTEQFALGLHYIVDNVEVSDTIVGSPPAVGDWLNLWQLGVVWICHSAL